MATELDISNGHAARMRYSRFKQQMEGTIATTAKTVKPKRATTKSDGKAAAAKSLKGKQAYNKGNKCSTNLSAGSKGKGDGNLDVNSKKRSAPEDFTKQEMMTYGVMPSIEREQQMSDFNSMLDSNTNTLCYLNPSNGVAFGSDTSFPYLPIQPTLQQQFSDFSPNFFLPREDTMFNQPFIADNYNAFSSEPLVEHQVDPLSWNQMDICFSGCCQPPRPSTPMLYQSYPLEHSESPLFCQSQPWTPEPFCQPQQPQNLWVPIKSEPGSEGSSDDIFVKVEPGM